MTTERWPMVIFYHLLDISAINAFKIWKLKNPAYQQGHSDAKRKFLLDLGRALVKQNVIYRYENVKNTHSQLKPAMNRRKQGLSGQGRCYLCDRKQDRKSRQSCSICVNFVCVQHCSQSVVCQNCKNK
jgi:uncharacterized protein VirK/YbjX